MCRRIAPSPGLALDATSAGAQDRQTAFGICSARQARRMARRPIARRSCRRASSSIRRRLFPAPDDRVAIGSLRHVVGCRTPSGQRAIRAPPRCPLALDTLSARASAMRHVVHQGLAADRLATDLRSYVIAPIAPSRIRRECSAMPSVKSTSNFIRASPRDVTARSASRCCSSFVDLTRRDWPCSGIWTSIKAPPRIEASGWLSRRLPGRRLSCKLTVKTINHSGIHLLARAMPRYGYRRASDAAVAELLDPTTVGALAAAPRELDDPNASTLSSMTSGRKRRKLVVSNPRRGAPR